MRGQSRNKNGALGEIARGFAVCIMTFLIISVIMSLILFFSADPTRYISFFSAAAFLVSSAISAIISSRLITNGLAERIFGCALFLIIMLLLSLILGGGSISGAALMNALCYALIFLFFTFIFKKKRASKHRKR